VICFLNINNARYCQPTGDQTMAKGSKEKYTDKQKRQAEHIEEGYEKRGTSKKEAERRAWATVNKESGGGKKSGSGRGKKKKKAAAKKGGKKAAKKKKGGRKKGGRKKGGRKKKS
jgi:hypothetical protein